MQDSAAHVRAAIAALSEVGAVTVVSSLYRTRPWGPIRTQPDFTNAAVALETMLGPQELLRALKALERRLGRLPQSERWGPRAIDLDILTYEDTSVCEPDLVIPHPRMRERAFVLVPLAEIDARYAALRDALSAEERASVVTIRA